MTAANRNKARRLNPWSCGKIVKIPISDFYFNMKVVQWKGKSITVEYDLFISLMKEWTNKDGWTKEQALDFVFEF